MKGWDKESLRHSAAKKYGKAPPYREKKGLISPSLKYKIYKSLPFVSISIRPELQAYYETEKKIKSLERDIKKFRDNMEAAKDRAEIERTKGETKKGHIQDWENLIKKYSKELKQQKEKLEKLSYALSQKETKIEKKVKIRKHKIQWNPYLPPIYYD